MASALLPLAAETAGGVNASAFWLRAARPTRIGASITTATFQSGRTSLIAFDLLSSAVLEGVDDAAEINRHELIVGSAGQLIQLMFHAIENRPFNAGKHAG